ncbi:hypothetical protein [Pseudomonas subflava]|uniref:hypothetical protein n=1 Tax=Pseudomonas subflava TaxID=2952933 RepID=UPI00207A8301|nr:hypothetical protein [Pseudomonas subflava]
MKLQPQNAASRSATADANGNASGLADFAEVPVWAPYGEIEFSRIATPPEVLPSQFARAIRWVPLQFDAQPFPGFERSYDLFGDGSLVLVPMAGHTPGSIDLFFTLDDVRRFFFTGDTPLGAWRGSPAEAWSTTTRRAPPAIGRGASFATGAAAASRGARPMTKPYSGGLATIAVDRVSDSTKV